MPEIARFYGIIIRMYARDHSPPHFHAEYGEFEAVVAINDLRLIRGSLPARARRLVLEWASMHQEELVRAWNSVASLEPPDRIAPLD